MNPVEEVELGSEYGAELESCPDPLDVGLPLVPYEYGVVPVGPLVAVEFESGYGVELVRSPEPLVVGKPLVPDTDVVL